MKSCGHRALLLTVLVVFFSCDNNITISKKLTHYNPRLHLSAIGENEKLPRGVRELLNQQSPSNATIPKFPLSYYLIQAQDARFLRSKKFDKKISDQLVFFVSGDKYYKLFVHPDSEVLYTFLERGYRYIGPTETEFVASPIPGNKTLVVWNPRNLSNVPFIVKTVLDPATVQEINSRFPATENAATPEMIHIIFSRSIKGSEERIEGEQITAIPNF